MKNCKNFSSKEKYYYFSEIITACPNQGSPNSRTYRVFINDNDSISVQVMGTLVPIQMIHPDQRSKNRCCEPIETLKYHRHPSHRVQKVQKPALNLISGLQALNHFDQHQFMSSLRMLPCMVFIIFSPDTIQTRDKHGRSGTDVSSGIYEYMFTLKKLFEDLPGVWLFLHLLRC